MEQSASFTQRHCSVTVLFSESPQDILPLSLLTHPARRHNQITNKLIKTNELLYTGYNGIETKKKHSVNNAASWVKL